MTLLSDAVHEQRISALQHANEIRHTRAVLKATWRKMPEHEVAAIVAMIVGDPTEDTRTWRISALLRAIPHWGDVAVNKRLRQLGIGSQLAVGDLTPGHRLALVELLAPQLLTDASQRTDQA